MLVLGSLVYHSQFPFDLPSGRKLSEQRLGLVLQWKKTIAGLVVSVTGFEVTNHRNEKRWIKVLVLLYTVGVWTHQSFGDLCGGYVKIDDTKTKHKCFGLVSMLRN